MLHAAAATKPELKPDLSRTPSVEAYQLQQPASCTQHPILAGQSQSQTMHASCQTP